MSPADAGDHLLHAGRLRVPVLARLEVDVMHDLPDLLHRRVADFHPRGAHLERALVLLMRERRARHAERHLRLPARRAGLYEAEARVRIEVAPDEPRRGYPVDPNVLPGDPDGAALQIGTA